MSESRPQLFLAPGTPYTPPGCRSVFISFIGVFVLWTLYSNGSSGRPITNGSSMPLPGQRFLVG